MKRSAILACIILVMLAVSIASAATLSLPEGDAAPGGECSLSLTAEQLGSVIAGDVALNYDSETLDVVSVTVGGAVSGARTVYLDKAGELRFSWAGTAPGDDSGTVATVAFSVSSDAEGEFMGVAIGRAALYTSAYETVTPVLSHGGVNNTAAAGGTTVPVLMFLLEE